MFSILVRRSGLGGLELIIEIVFAPDDRDFVEECRVNCDMMRRVAGAVNVLCPRLESFVYSGGTRVSDFLLHLAPTHTTRGTGYTSLEAHSKLP